MPAKSEKQYNLMAMVAAGKKPSKLKSIGPSQAVAREFVKETPKKKRSIFARRES